MQSANIVGYNTVNVTKGNYIGLSVQFEEVASANSTIKIKNLLSGFTPKGAGKAGGNCDQIWVWDNTKAVPDWNKYFYRVYENEEEEMVTVGWVLSGGDTSKATEDEVKVGDSIFFYRGGNDTTVTLAGGVKQFTGSATYDVTKGNYHMMAYPWPTALPIKEFTNFITAKGAGKAGGNCDQIWVWDNTKAVPDWNKYFYRVYENEEEEMVTVGWVLSGGDTSVETNDSIPVGTGFFYYRGGNSGTVTFTPPTVD